VWDEVKKNIIPRLECYEHWHSERSRRYREKLNTASNSQIRAPVYCAIHHHTDDFLYYLNRRRDRPRSNRSRTCQKQMNLTQRRSPGELNRKVSVFKVFDYSLVQRSHTRMHSLDIQMWWMHISTDVSPEVLRKKCSIERDFERLNSTWNSIIQEWSVPLCGSSESKSSHRHSTKIEKEHL
jgi:hypothetical protein